MQKIIDFHCHIFPDRIAQKATRATGEYYGVEMALGGTVNELLEQYNSTACEKIVVHSSATVATQVTKINDFIYQSMQKNIDKLIGFGSLHPDMDDPYSEVARIKAMGLKGIKLHPDFQNFELDSEHADDMFRAIGEKYPVLIHLGDEKTDKSHPQRMYNLAKRFPYTTFVGAHLGGYAKWQVAEGLLAGLDNMFFDTSSSLSFLEPEYAASLIKKYGTKHVVFATDYPMWKFDDEIARFNKLNLTGEECEDIFYNNAASILEIENDMR